MGFNFTAEEIERAKSIGIVGVAERLGFKPEKSDRRTYKIAGLGGFYLFPDTNKYYCFSTEEKGDVIDFVQRARACSFKEAIEFLDSSLIEQTPESKKLNIKIAKKHNEEELKNRLIFEKPKPDKNNRRIIWYLTHEREIEESVVEEAIQRGIIYQDKRKNVVFLGFDSLKVPRYAALRGTDEKYPFKGDVGGSEKKYGFEWKGSGHEVVYVVESPIDVLSLVSLWRMQYGDDSDYNKFHVISLGGGAIRHLDQFLEENRKIKCINLALDDDIHSDINHGMENTRRIIESLKSRFGDKYEIMISTPLNKDWNEDLVAIKRSSREIKEYYNELLLKRDLREDIEL